MIVATIRLQVIYMNSTWRPRVSGVLQLLLCCCDWRLLQTERRRDTDWLMLQNSHEDFDEVVDANQVAVFVVPHFPFGVVGDGHIRGQMDGFCKVNQPHIGIVAIMDEQQRTPNHLLKIALIVSGNWFQKPPYLMGFEERRLSQGGLDRLKSLNVLWLQKEQRQLKTNGGGHSILTTTCGNPSVKLWNAAMICSLDLVVLKSLLLVPSEFLIPSILKPRVAVDEIVSLHTM